MKCIVIKNCGECPNVDHKGGFGQTAYIPVCRKTGDTLPYTTTQAPSGRNYAAGTGVIPDNCPLLEYKEL